MLHVSDRLDTAWLARRQQFHVPSLRPDCPPLLQVDLGDTDVTTGARAIDNLWVLGRKHPRIRPLAARWLQPAEPWEQLQVCMLCPGVCEPERVALAADLRVEEMDGEVEEMDGEAVHAFNEHVAASGYYRRRRADVHVASQGALRTARSSGCSLLTSGRRLDTFNPQCPECLALDKNLRQAVKRRAAAPATGERMVKLRATNFDGVKNSTLSREELLAKVEHFRSASKKLRRAVKLLQAAAALREKEGIAVADDDQEDFSTIIRDPGVQAEMKKDFEGGNNAVVAALMEDQMKYAALKDKRGMRWHPQTIRWCLLFYTRANTGAWDELSSVLHLPSGRTLRGYRNAHRGGGFSEAALARMAAHICRLEKSALTELVAGQDDEITAALAARPRLPTERLGPIVEGRKCLSVLREMRHRHREERDLLQAQQRWDRLGCISFDTMKMAKRILWNSKTMEIEGFEDLFGVDEEEVNLSKLLGDGEHQQAAELQVFWFTSFGKEKLSFALGHFALSSPTSTILHPLWRQAVRAAQGIGLRPVAGCCDGASENEKLIKELTTSDQGDHYVDAASGDKIFMMSCQTHLVRTPLWSRHVSSTSHCHWLLSCCSSRSSATTSGGPAPKVGRTRRR